MQGPKPVDSLVTQTYELQAGEDLLQEPKDIMYTTMIGLKFTDALYGARN